MFTEGNDDKEVTDCPQGYKPKTAVFHLLYGAFRFPVSDKSRVVKWAVRLLLCIQVTCHLTRSVQALM